jgi:hypothetical protein
MDIVDRMVEEQLGNDYYGCHTEEEHYEFWKKYNPEYAEQNIEGYKLRAKVYPQILRMKLEKKTYTQIALELNMEAHKVQKMGKPLLDRYNRLLEDNINKVNKAAGDLRDRKVKEDLNYINDARTVYSDFTVLLPRVEEIKGLIDA